MTGFVVVRHPDIEVAGVLPVAALEYHQIRGWYRVSDDRPEPGDFDLDEYGPDSPDLDAPEDNQDPDGDEPEATTDEEQEQQ
jgi:hypothetical protein